MLFCACPCLWGLKGGRKIVEQCQIYEALLMNWIFSVFKVDLIRDRHSGRVLFHQYFQQGETEAVGRNMQEYYAFQKLLTLHAHTGSSSESFVHFSSSTITHLLPKLFCACQNSLFPSPWWTLFLAVITIVGVLYCINLLTNGPL